MDLLALIVAPESSIPEINSGSANGVMDWIMQKFAKNARSCRGLVMMKSKPVAWRKEEDDGDFFLSIMGGEGWEPLYDQSVADHREKLLSVLIEYIAAADEIVHGEDDVTAMLRLGEADKEARTVIAEIEATK